VADETSHDIVEQPRLLFGELRGAADEKSRDPMQHLDATDGRPESQHTIELVDEGY
jgi:hypothetical protein